MSAVRGPKVAIVDNSIDPTLYKPVEHWSAHIGVEWEAFRAPEFLLPDLGKGYSHLILTGSEASLREKNGWTRRSNSSGTHSGTACRSWEVATGINSWRWPWPARPMSGDVESQKSAGSPSTSKRTRRFWAGPAGRIRFLSILTKSRTWPTRS